MPEDRIDHLARMVYYLKQGNIRSVNGGFADQGTLEPLDQTAPKVASDQDDRDLPRLAGLDQCQDLGQLIQGAKPPGSTT